MKRMQAQSRKEIKFIIISFLILLLLMLGVKVFNKYEMEVIHATTLNLYEHPLQVSNAALNVEKEIYKIHRDMKDIVLAESTEELNEFIRVVDKREKIIYRDLAIIKKNILGDAGLNLQEQMLLLFKNWKPIRDEVIALKKNNKTVKAASITKGKGAQHILNMENIAHKLYMYALNKAKEFKDESILKSEKLKNITMLADSVFFIVFILIAYYTIARISKYIIRMSHLNNLLPVIRNINQLIVKENRLDKLLQESCDLLESSYIYGNAWIITFDENNKVENIIGTDDSENFRVFKDKIIKHGWSPYCIDKIVNIEKHYSNIKNTKQTCSECLMKDAYHTNSAFTIELKYNNKIYGYLNMSIEKKYLFDKDELGLLDEVAGNIAYAIYSIHLAEKVKKSESIYRTMFQGNRTVELIVDPSNGSVVDANAAACKYYGYRHEELIGMHISDINTLSKEELKLKMQSVKNEESEKYYFKHKLANGDVRDVQVYSGPIKLDEKKLLYSIVFDITDKLKLEREQKESQNTILDLKELYYNTISSIDSLIYVKDTNFTYISCNSGLEKLLGKSKDEIIGKNDYELFSKEIADSFRKHDEETFVDNNTTLDYQWVTFPNSKNVYFFTTKSPLLDDTGKVIGLVGNSVDLTEQHYLSELLQESQKQAKLGSWEKTFDDDILFWSDEVYNIFEFDSKETMTYEEFLDCVHPDDRNELRISFETSIEEHALYYLEHRLLFSDGRVKYVLERAEHFYDKKGKHIRSLGTVQDITDKKVLEQELQKSHDALYKLTENIPGAIFQYRLYPDGRASIPYASQGIENVYEVTFQDVLQDASTSFKNIHPDDLSMLEDSIKESAQTMKEWNLEYRSNLPKKGVRWLQGKAKPERLEDGSILWHGIVNDITEQREISNALTLSNTRYEVAERLGKVGSWEYDIETEMFWASNESKEIYGLQVGLENFTTEVVEGCIPERDRVHQALVDLLEKGKEYKLEFEINPIDGSAPKIIFSTATVAFDEFKKPIKVIGFIQDVTEKRENLKLLQQKTKELESIIENAPNPMMIHEEGGKILMLNQAWIDSSGFSLEETQTINDLLNNMYDDEKIKTSVKEHIDSMYGITEKVDEGEFTLLNKNRDYITWQFSSAPLGVIDGKRTVITSAMDITELKHKDEMLINQSRYVAMGEMTGMIAHQWRQPLASISAISGTLTLDIMMNKYDGKYFQEKLDSISGLSQHLSSTVDDFRNFFKPDKVISKVNIKDTIDQTLSIVKDSLKNHNIKLTSSFETDTEVDAYPRELMQVFVNIINNSKDALVSQRIENPLIEIRVYEDKKYINTEICDNGGGIDANTLPKVFDPYFSTKDEKTGTGLGLHMSKMIIEEHLNGIIEVKNNDDGACFTVRLLK